MSMKVKQHSGEESGKKKVKTRGCMAFSATIDQVRDRTKRVTRRHGKAWKRLQPGDLLRAVNKGLGLKKGEQQEQLALIRVLDVRVERLDAITAADVEAEGFPDWGPKEFIKMFCEKFRATPDTKVRRIEFEYVD